jgi:hypothetical protein
MILKGTCAALSCCFRDLSVSLRGTVHTTEQNPIFRGQTHAQRHHHVAFIPCDKLERLLPPSHYFVG